MQNWAHKMKVLKDGPVLKWHVILDVRSLPHLDELLSSAYIPAINRRCHFGANFAHLFA